MREMFDQFEEQLKEREKNISDQEEEVKRFEEDSKKRLQQKEVHLQERFQQVEEKLKQDLFKQVNEREDKLKKGQDILETEKRSWEEEQEAVKQTKVFEKIVTLDVGGTKYRTSLATLKGHPQSMLGIMFSGRHSLEQQMDGSYFIDRDGDTFKYVIMYLRDPVTAFLAIPSLQKSTRQLIRYEAHFFQLNDLERYCQTTLQRTINLSSELKHFTVTIGRHKQHEEYYSCEYNPNSRFQIRNHLSGEYADITYGNQLIGSKIDATFRHCDLSNVTFKECFFVKDPCFEGCVLFNANFESVGGLISNKVHFTPWQIQQAVFEPELLDALKKNELIY